MAEEESRQEGMKGKDIGEERRKQGKKRKRGDERK